ncbi:zinc-ribbon domain-containing protein [Emcibacter sp.]|uniref:zinc-ribbon domain-containing protein n=1 Tax=Emcibacter sp. TaxID=1979954 RepID=UPI002AA85627|nr:MJ0042-type zinc finger domain-containing protein [Emcibacter sp.]
MILTCPECLAKYVVDPKALLPAGRTVRCAKCRHTWHESPPAADIPVINEAEDKVSLAEETEPAEETAPSPEETPKAPHPDAGAHEGSGADFDLSIRQRKKRPRPIPKGSNLPALQNHHHGSSKWGWVALCAFVTIVISGLLIFHDTITELWPPSGKLYHAIGLDGEAAPTHVTEKKKEEPRLPVSERLVIQNLVPAKESRNGTSYLVVRGEVRNITETKQEVPPLQVSLQDARGVTIRNWTFMTSPGILPPEDVVGFETALPNPPADARDLRVSFTEE